MAKKRSILAVDLTEDVNTRFLSLCQNTGLAKNAIARLAIEAAVKAGEEHGGRLVVPIEFDVRYLPARKTIG